jgi:hypothetical protein
MIIIHNVIILRRGTVCVLNEGERQLHFEECHAVTLSMLFLGLVYLQRKVILYACVTTMWKRLLRILLGKFEFYSKTLCLCDVTGQCG